MPRAIIAAAVLFAFATSASAQFMKSADRAAQQAATEKDHKLMMEALKIKSLRPGANGMNPKAPNAANYDESKANPYPNLPDPLVLKNGERVATAEMWWAKRRPEIVEDFDREIYGRVPKDVPKVTWEITSTTHEKVGDVAVVTKRLVGHADNSKYPEIKVDIQLTLTTPADAKGPVPVMMEFGFGNFFGPRPGGPGAAAKKAMAKAATKGAGFGGFGSQWPLVLAKGWGYAIIVPYSVQADNGAGLTKGIIGLCNKGQPRKPDDWGALGPGPGAPAAPWIISRPTRPWTPSRSGSRGCLASARRRSSRWPTTRASLSASSAPRARVGPSCTAATSASWSRTSPDRASITGWRGTSSSTAAR